MTESPNELKILKEFLKAVEFPEKEILRTKRLGFAAGIFGGVVLFLSGFLIYWDSLPPIWAVLAGFLSGSATFFGLFFKLSAEQIPYLNKYFEVRKELLQARIDVLESECKPKES